MWQIMEMDSQGRAKGIFQPDALCSYRRRKSVDMNPNERAELARLGHVTRARVTQIMNLLLLAPDIHESLLYLPRGETGDDPVEQLDLQRIAAEMDLRRQLGIWQTTRRTNDSPKPAPDWCRRHVPAII